MAGNQMATAEANMSDMPGCLERPLNKGNCHTGYDAITREIAGRLTSNLRVGSSNLSERASEIKDLNRLLRSVAS